MAQVKDKSKKKFSLDKVDMTVKLTKAVEIPPCSSIQVHGITKVKGHDKRFNLIVEPKRNVCNPSVVVVPSYPKLRPGSKEVNMSLRNLTSRNLTVKAKVIVAHMATANVVPPMLTPKNSQELEKQKEKRMKSCDKYSEAPIKVQLTKDQLNKLFDKIDLSGIKDWSKKDQEDV